LIAGGYRSRNISDCFILDIIDYTLSPVKDLPYKDEFSNPSTLSLDGSLYALGNSKKIYKYNISKFNWEVLLQID